MPPNKDEVRGSVFRRILQEELRSMASILKLNPDFCQTPQELESAADQLLTEGHDGALSWHYNLSGLVFLFKKPLGTRPSNLTAHLKIEVDVRATGKIGRPSHDPFHDSLVNLRIRPDVPGDPRRDAWHFDKHKYEHTNSTPADVHPRYHLEQGGVELELLGDEVGNLILLHHPRIAYPPMDAILAVDFVLSQYLGKIWIELRNNPQYRQTVSDAQTRLWQPHYSELANHWSATESPDAIFLQPTLYPV